MGAPRKRQRNLLRSSSQPTLLDRETQWGQGDDARNDRSQRSHGGEVLCVDGVLYCKNVALSALCAGFSLNPREKPRLVAMAIPQGSYSSMFPREPGNGRGLRHAIAMRLRAAVFLTLRVHPSETRV
jgi:hypothetical protein